MNRDEAQFDREFETRGEWWLPGHQDKAITGTLSYHPESGLSLETLGDFSANLAALLNQGHDHQPIILGRSEGGTEITLHRCYRSNLKVSLGGGYSTQSYRALEGFFGRHFADPSNLVFHSASFSITHLESWLGAVPFKEDWPKDNAGKGLTLTFHPPQHFKAYLGSIESYVESRHTMNTKSEGWFDRTWTYRSLLYIQPKVPKDFRWHLEQSSNLKDLVSLLTGERTYFRFLRFSQDADEKSTIYALFSQSVEPRKKSIHPQKMLVPFACLTQQVERTMDAWFRDSVELGPVHDLLFSVFYKPDLYIQSQLLHLMQAVETFHRRTQGGQYLDQDKFKELTATLRAAIPEWVTGEFKDVLRGRLSFQNDLSLKSRMKALVSGLPQKLTDRFLGDPKHFVKEICDTRDHLTHYSKELGVSDLRELAQTCYQFVTQLTVILTFYLLRQIEISEEAACAGILQKYHYLKKPSLPAPK